MSSAAEEAMEAVPLNGPLDAVAAVGPGDQTGTETLGRYAYQFKVALQRWLRTLSLPTDSRVLCEFVDDVATDTGSTIEFAQVKTRDRGSWSASKVLAPGGGIDALVRSYNHAKTAGVVASTRYELILEGPASEGPETKAFFEDPKSATSKQRTTLVKLGLQRGDLDPFLSRLTITPQFHARQSIDAAGMYLLMSLVGGHSSDIAELYLQLLRRVEEAHLGQAASANPATPSVLQAPPTDEHGRAAVLEHQLTRAELVGLLPPIPALVEEQVRLIEAANDGPRSMSMLEFKLQVAGAGPKTIERAKTRRAAVAITVEERRGQGTFEVDLEALGSRILEHAEAVVQDISTTAGSAERRSRPADAVYGRLVQQRSELGKLDALGLLDNDGDLVLGLLCQLSDQCLFPWRAA